MAWIRTFVNPSDPRMLLRSLQQQGRARGFISSLANGKVTGVPDARTLRQWTQTNGFIKAALTVRRSQISTADWDVIVATPNLPDREQSRAKAACQRARKLLQAPNPAGKNNSFQGLIEPLVEDLLTLGVNTTMKSIRMDGSIYQLSDVDAARLRLVKGWQSDDDGPRYVIVNEDNRTGKLYMNNELITMFYEPVTYDELGTPPLRALHQRLVAFQQTFESVSDLQSNRVPPTLINFQGMDNAGLERMKRLLQDELLGQSMVGFFNYPIEDVSKIELADMNLQEQGVAWFVDWMIREICAAFRVSTLQLNWTQDVNRATAKEQIKMSLDDGVVPVMKMISGYINREIIATFGNPNIEFVWTELVSKDEPVDAAILEKQAGPLVYMSVNELRIAAGLHPAELDRTDPLFVWWNDPWVPTATGMVAPLSIAAKMPEYQPQVQDAAITATVAQHNRNEQDAKNPPEQQPAPQKYLDELQQYREDLIRDVELRRSITGEAA